MRSPIATYHGGFGGGGGTIDNVARADIAKVSAPTGAIIPNKGSTFGDGFLWTNNSGGDLTVPTPAVEANYIATGFTQGAESSGGNTSTGNGAPPNATGANFYYIQLDAATGTNNLWGPSIANGSFPAQADFSITGPSKYSETFVIADFVAGTYSLPAATHGLGTGFKHVTVYNATNEVIGADVPIVDPVTGDISIISPLGYEFDGAITIS